MAWGRKQKMDNAATLNMPPPQTTVNHPGTPWGTIVFSTMSAVIILLIFIWQVLVFLLGRAGTPHPDRVLASGLLDIGYWLFIFILAISISTVLGHYLVSQVTEYLRYRLDTQLEIHKYKYQTAQQLPATSVNRMTNEEKRKYRAIMAVMERAFQMVDKDGRLQTRTEPWSRRSVGRLQLLNESIPIGENSKLALSVKPWLLEKGILLSDSQMNIEEFPNLPAIQTLLFNEFGPSINI